MIFPSPSVIRGSTALTRQALTLQRLCTTQIYYGQVKVGDVIPSSELYETPTKKVNLLELTSDKKVVLFAVSGAFAPGCTKIHLQGYLNKAKAMKKDGISEIICVSMNDPYVMNAWSERTNAEGKVRMLADPSGKFAKALGLTMEIPVLGGLRLKRFSMIINDCLVEELNIEPDGTGLSCSLVNELKYRHEDKGIEKS